MCFLCPLSPFARWGLCKLRNTTPASCIFIWNLSTVNRKWGHSTRRQRCRWFASRLFCLFKRRLVLWEGSCLCLSPGNIWNRSAGWPGLVLPRLTVSHTNTHCTHRENGPNFRAFTSLHPLTLLSLLLNSCQFLSCPPLYLPFSTPLLQLSIPHRWVFR